MALTPAEVVLMPVDLIQAINADIPGIEWAPKSEDYPVAVDTASMPMAVTFPGQGSTEVPNNSLRIMERQYLIDVYVEPVGQGLLADIVQQTMALDSLFVHTWTSRFNELEEQVLDFGDKSKVRVEIVRDTPILDSGWRMDLQWMPEQSYYGFRITLPLLLRWGEGLR